MVLSNVSNTSFLSNSAQGLVLILKLTIMDPGLNSVTLTLNCSSGLRLLRTTFRISVSSLEATSANVSDVLSASLSFQRVLTIRNWPLRTLGTENE